MKKLIQIIVLTIMSIPSTIFGMEKKLQFFKQDIEKLVYNDCPITVLDAYKKTYKTIQLSLKEGLLNPALPNWFIKNAHITIVLKKYHPVIHETLINHGLPLAQGNISPSEFETKVNSMFHPIILSMFSIPFQQYLIEKKYELLKVQNITDFNTLSAQEKNMFTVALLNLSHKELNKECETALAKILPYYEILRKHTEKIYKLRDRMNLPEQQQPTD